RGVAVGTGTSRAAGTLAEGDALRRLVRDAGAGQPLLALARAAPVAAGDVALEGTGGAEGREHGRRARRVRRHPGGRRRRCRRLGDYLPAPALGSGPRADLDGRYGAAPGA